MWCSKPVRLVSDVPFTVKESELMRRGSERKDFYAATPALAPINHLQSGCESRVDYATSLTGAVEVKLQPGGGNTADRLWRIWNAQPVAFRFRAHEYRQGRRLIR